MHFNGLTGQMKRSILHPTRRRYGYILANIQLPANGEQLESATDFKDTHSPQGHTETLDFSSQTSPKGLAENVPSSIKT